MTERISFVSGFVSVCIIFYLSVMEVGRYYKKVNLLLQQVRVLPADFER